MSTASGTSDRLLAPDLARGFMLLLIALAHAPLLVTSTAPATADARFPPAASLADQVVNLGLAFVVFSRSFPLFAVLLGYGPVLMVRSRRRQGLADAQIRTLTRRRGWWMLVFGLGMALLITPVEILGAYGVITVLLAGVLIRGDRALRFVIAGLAGPAVVTAAALGLLLSGGPEQQALGHLGYTPVDLGYRLVSWLLSVVMNVTLFPIPLAVLVGVWAGRRRLLEDPRRHRQLLSRVVAIGFPVSVLGAVPLALVTTGVLAAAAGWSAQALHVLTGLAGGFAYAALFGLIGGRVRATARWTRPLTSIGRRSLTCYIVIEASLVVLSSTTFLGLGARIGPAGAAGIAVAAWLLAAMLAELLERTGRRGPAEWLLRRLVDRRRRPSATDRDPRPPSSPPPNVRPVG